MIPVNFQYRTVNFFFLDENLCERIRIVPLPRDHVRSHALWTWKQFTFVDLVRWPRSGHMAVISELGAYSSKDMLCLFDLK